MVQLAEPVEVDGGLAGNCKASAQVTPSTSPPKGAGLNSITAPGIEAKEQVRLAVLTGSSGPLALGDKQLLSWFRPLRGSASLASLLRSGRAGAGGHADRSGRWCSTSMRVCGRLAGSGPGLMMSRNGPVDYLPGHEIDVYARLPMEGLIAIGSRRSRRRWWR